MKGIVGKVLDSSNKVINFLKLENESGFIKFKSILSYYTGVGWKHLEEDKYKDFHSRSNQINEVQVNSKLTRSYLYRIV